MTATQTETAQANGDTLYHSKFIPQVVSIPVVDSLKKQLFARVPQAEALSRFVGNQLGKGFSYTHDTPIEPMLIKLDTLAADGVAKLQKGVPIVNTTTDEALKTTRLDRVMDLFTHYYVVCVGFIYNVFNVYKSFFDPSIDIFLARFEALLEIKPSKEDTQSARIYRIRTVIIEKVDMRVTPVSNQIKETVTSVYSTTLVPLVQYPLKLFDAQRAKALETLSPIIAELKSRYTKAEATAKQSWVQTKPDVSGPNAVLPAIKSGIFVVITFGYNLVYAAPKKPVDKPRVEDQTNGLVSGVELNDGSTMKRPNGMAS